MRNQTHDLLSEQDRKIIDNVMGQVSEPDRKIYNRILHEGHPSFGTCRAVFIFALGQGPTRIILVEAQNAWAVLCIERLLLADGKVSKICQSIGIVREYRNVGTRHEMAEEIPFVDFILDIVDMSKLMGDPIVLETFSRSMSDNERKYALDKLQLIQKQNNSVSAPPPPPIIVSEGPDQSEKLASALVGLGFKKTDVRQFVNKLGNKIKTDDLQSLIRTGLRELAV